MDNILEVANISKDYGDKRVVNALSFNLRKGSIGCSANVLIRPEDIAHDDESPLRAEILRKDFRGANILYTLKLRNSENVLALVSSHHDHAIGQEIGIQPQVDELILFEHRSGG